MRDARLEDAGVYAAVVGEEQVSARLTVEDFLELVQGLKDQTVTEKDTLKLSVEVSDKSIAGQWFKNGQPIEASDQYVMSSLNGMLIYGLRDEDVVFFIYFILKLFLVVIKLPE